MIWPMNSRIRTTISTPPRMFVAENVDDDELLPFGVPAPVKVMLWFTVASLRIAAVAACASPSAVDGLVMAIVSAGLRGRERLDVLHADPRGLHRDQRALPGVVELADSSFTYCAGCPKSCGTAPRSVRSRISATRTSKPPLLACAIVLWSCCSTGRRDLLRDRRVQRAGDQDVARRIAVGQGGGRRQRAAEDAEQHEKERQAAHSAQGTTRAITP